MSIMNTPRTETPIQKQRWTMKAALRKLDEIDAVNRLVKPVDPKACEAMIKELQEEYADLMTDLAEQFLQIPTLGYAVV